MKILETPILDHPRCYRFKFTAPLKCGRKKFKNSDAELAYYRAEIDSYVDELNSRFVGSDYTMLTGQALRREIKITPAAGACPARAEIKLTCPLRVPQTTFEAVACQTWRATKIAGEAIYIDNPNYSEKHPQEGWWRRTFGD